MENKKKIEIFIMLALVVVAGIAIWMKVTMTDKVDKEQALMAELRAMRTAVQTYLIINKNFPPNLKALANEKYMLGGKEDNYIKGIKLDGEGFPVSALGERFEYDTGTGWVSAPDKKYKGW